MIEPGETFRDLDRTIDPRNHLWIAVSRPIAGNVALVNFTTHRPWLDIHRHCLVVQADEHPWLKHESCIAFGFARMWEIDDLLARQRLGRLRRDERCSPDLLRRVQLAALDAVGTHARVKAAIRATLDEVG